MILAAVLYAAGNVVFAVTPVFAGLVIGRGYRRLSASAWRS